MILSSTVKRGASETTTVAVPVPVCVTPPALPAELGLMGRQSTGPPEAASDTAAHSTSGPWPSVVDSDPRSENE